MPTSRGFEQTLISSTPKIGVLFFPFTYRYKGLTATNFMDVTRTDATSSVTHFTYQKSKSEASGSFSIEMKGDKDWTTVLRPGDWVMLYESAFGVGIRGPGKDTTQGLRLLGNIDRVSRQKVITQDGKKIYTYKVDGRDFGKVFEKLQFYYNPYIPDRVQENFVIMKSGIKITGTPAEFVRSYLDLYVGKGWIKDAALPDTQGLKQLPELDQMRIPQPILNIFGNSGSEKEKTGRLMDILRIEIGGANGQLTPEGFSWSIPPEKATNGTLWDILQSVANPAMNEMFTCMKYYPAENKVFPTLVLRQLPYAKDIFPKLPRVYIQENMIINDDMGFNDHERYNWINLDPQSSFIANYPQFMAASQATRKDPVSNKDVPLFPFINTISVQRYGLNQLHLQSEFVMVTEGERQQSSSKTDLQLAEEWMRKIIEWWQDYERYESGTILIKGFSEVNVFKAGKDGTIFLNNFEQPKDLQGVQRKILGNSDGKDIPSDQYNIGNNMFLNTRDRLYQLEGFSLEWTAPGESVTTLAVTRGVHWRPNDSEYRFVDEVDSKDQKQLSVTVVKR